MLTILSPLIVFGLVIFVHELGHFLAAKSVGVYAPRFSIGFGPALWRRRFGETEYVLAVLPLGGYVRMASRHDEETAFIEGGNEEAAKRAPDDPNYDPEAMIPFGPKPVPENRWFESKPLWARLLIMIAGVTMNGILAIVVMTVLAFHFGRAVYPGTEIGAVRAVASAPQLAALRIHDTITAVNGREVKNWNDVTSRILRSRDTVHIATRRTTVHVPLAAGVTGQQIADALVYFIAPVFDSVGPGGPAAQAGIQRGDSVVSMEGKSVQSWTDMVDVVTQSPGKPLKLVVARAAKIETLTVTPRAAADTDARGIRPRPRIDAAARDVSRTERLGPIEALAAGTRASWGMATSVIGFLHQLITGQMSVKQLGGPIAITRASVTAARNGIEELFYLIALLSVNVLVLNLLPIPILDGGQILINVAESAKGSPFSMRTREYIMRFGLVAIALLFAIVMYNDTRGGLAKLFGWVARLFG